MGVERPPATGRRAVPAAANTLLFLAFAASQCYLLGGPPLLGLPAWSAPAAALFTTAVWALLHEAIHGLLFPRPIFNQAGGRLLALLFGASFALLRAGHLLHHRYSRTGDLSETWEPGRETYKRAALRHYGTILGGLYLAEILAGLAMFLPAGPRCRLIARCLPANALGKAFGEWLERPGVAAEIRTDALAALALFAAAFALWGGDWPWLAAALALRGLLLSFFDNAYHYGTPAGDPAVARNHRLPAWASAAILHFNYHGTHHRHPAAPWCQLPAQAVAEGARWEGGYWRQAWRQLRGPIALTELPGHQPLRATNR